MAGGFETWSPSQLAHAVGVVVDLVDGGASLARPVLVFADGARLPTSYQHARRYLTALAAERGVDPASPPSRYPRALINGVDVNGWREEPVAFVEREAA